MGDCLAISRRIVCYTNTNNKVDLFHNEKEIDYGTVHRQRRFSSGDRENISRTFIKRIY